MPLSHFFTFIIGYYLKKKKDALENVQRVPPPRNSPPVSPASEDLSPVSPQVSQDSVPPLELHNEQANQETQDSRKKVRGQQNPNNQVIRKEAQQVPRRRGRSQQNVNSQENTTKKRTKK